MSGGGALARSTPEQGLRQVEDLHALLHLGSLLLSLALALVAPFVGAGAGLFALAALAFSATNEALALGLARRSRWALRSASALHGLGVVGGCAALTLAFFEVPGPDGWGAWLALAAAVALVPGCCLAQLLRQRPQPGGGVEPRELTKYLWLGLLELVYGLFSWSSQAVLPEELRWALETPLRGAHMGGSLLCSLLIVFLVARLSEATRTRNPGEGAGRDP